MEDQVDKHFAAGVERARVGVGETVLKGSQGCMEAAPVF